MNRKTGALSVFAGLIVAVIMLFKPAQFEAESTFFVPLTLLEKQINQNGMGFGSPVEVDAHLELMDSRTIGQLVEERFGPTTSYDVSRTRNGAVLVTARALEPETAAMAANAIVVLTDSVKQHMLRQNVGQSLSFVDDRSEELEAESEGVRKTLDSLRFEAQTDSLALAALLFQKERQYGAAVVEWTKMQRKQEELKGYLKAPAPKSYIISKAIVPSAPAGLPWWLSGILAALVVGVLLWSASLLSK
jgi:hypothetical protein